MSLREAKSAATKNLIINVSVDLFLARGFHQTRVDDIAAAANISRRTFFNYFPTKQDVLSDWFQLQGECLADCVASRPKDECPWASLEYAYRTMRDSFGRESTLVLKLRCLLVEEPALLAKKYQCLIVAIQRLTPLIKTRIAETESGTLAAQIYVQAAMAAYNSACAEWEPNPGDRSFEDVLQRAFALAKPAIVLPPT